MRINKAGMGLAVLTAAGLVLGASSCEPQKSTGGQPNGKAADQIYNETQNGMTKEQVKQVAGRDFDRCQVMENAGLPKQELCYYGSVQFVFDEAGKVTGKNKY